MTLLYLIVRLSVYTSEELDEWTDGILYGTAAGLGMATWANLAFIVEADGAEPGAAAVRIVVNALVMGSLGGLVGGSLGHDRLEVRPLCGGCRRASWPRPPSTASTGSCGVPSRAASPASRPPGRGCCSPSCSRSP